MLKNKSQTYLQSYKNYFWEWEKDEGDHSMMAVLVDGPAIAHFNIIQSLIKDLDGNSLPPFGVLLLLLFATRPQTKSKHLNSLSEYLINLRYKNTGIKGGFVTFNSAMKLLKLIVKLPDITKTEVNRRLLISSLLKGCEDHLEEAVYKQLILDLDKFSFVNNKTFNNDIEVPMPTFYQEVRVLSLLSVQYTTSEKLLALLNQTSHSNNIDLLPTVKVEEDIYLLPHFVEKLKQYESLYKTASLIKYLWSGIQMPKENEIPSKQPLGGVTDIANKGDFDRMLISEFASSEDIFLSRLANNDILFRDREVPPQKSVSKSIYLLDISLISWGIPKIIEQALFLSFISKKKPKHINQLVTIGKDARHMPFSTLSDIFNLHNIIDSNLHCVSGLNDFLLDYIVDDKVEVIVLTTDESVDMPEVKKAIETYRSKINILITSSRFGEINSWLYTKNDKVLLQNLILPLEELWAEEYQWNGESLMPKGLLSKTLDFDSQYPLLFPWLKYQEKVYQLNKQSYLLYDNAIWLWHNNVKGIELIINLSSVSINPKMSTIAIDQNKEVAFFVYDRDKHCIQKFTLKNKKRVEIYLDRLITPNVLICNRGKLVVQNSQEKSWQMIQGNRFVEINQSELEQVINKDAEINEFQNQIRKEKIHNYNVLKNIDFLQVRLSNSDDDITQFYLGKKYYLNWNDKYTHITPNSYSRFNAEKKPLIEFTPYADLYIKRFTGDYNTLSKALKRHKIDLEEKDLNIEGSHIKILENKILQRILLIKKDLESNGVICYYKTPEFRSLDGSIIKLFKGILEFKSSNSKIKPFYMPSVIDYDLGVASKRHFSGNEYFFNENLEKIDYNQFYNIYMEPFTEIIRKYGH